MPATNVKYTLNIEPVGDHLQVTIPEIGVTVETTGNTRREAEDVGLRAITDYLMRTRQRRSTARRAKTSRSRSSTIA
jgi:hypothetical protein